MGSLRRHSFTPGLEAEYDFRERPEPPILVPGSQGLFDHAAFFLMSSGYSPHGSLARLVVGELTLLGRGQRDKGTGNN